METAGQSLSRGWENMGGWIGVAKILGISFILVYGVLVYLFAGEIRMDDPALGMVQSFVLAVPQAFDWVYLLAGMILITPAFLLLGILRPIMSTPAQKEQIQKIPTTTRSKKRMLIFVLVIGALSAGGALWLGEREFWWYLLLLGFIAAMLHTIWKQKEQ